ncbi:MAG: DUF4397 domain-containing protein [Rhodothermaceae bacterium]|nr:DUF4397 domain-containing protein [Rhodothermaceae bacterium]
MAAPVGVLAPDDFAPNPDGRDTRLTLATGEIPNAEPTQGGMATVLLLHGVTDAPTIDVLIDGQLTIDDLAFGQFSAALSLAPSPHQITLRRASDGTTLGSYQVDLTTAPDERRTVTLTGFLDPGANGNGPPLTVTLVDENGMAAPVPTATEPGLGETPTAVRLLDNYPNPFTAATMFTIVLPREEHVRLAVYDLMGREIAVLVDERIPAGTHTVPFARTDLASGAYLYRLEASAITHTKRMLHVR